MSTDERRRKAPSSERGFDVPAKLSYGSYLKLDRILSSQELLSTPPHNDELLFIVAHQTYELWFRLVLATLEDARAALFDARLDDAEHHLARVHEIERVLVQQVGVLETMTPIGFLGFRDRLRPASGFQSFQFREIEILSGLRDTAHVEALRREEVPEVTLSVERRLAEPSLRDAMHAMLERRGIAIGWDAATRAWDDEKLGAALVEMYRTLEPREVYRVLEALVEHDQLVALWRQRHVLMVERMIGSKPGTGGSSGAAYLRTTTSRRFFPELWRVRGELSAEGY
jgi:tryptophan 2,3-dioxygenase